MTDSFAGKREPTSESLEVCKFAEVYSKRTCSYLSSDRGVTAAVLKRLARYKDDFGAELCPGRHDEDKKVEGSQAFWNYLRVPMRERKECHNMFFLTEDSPLRGEHQTIATATIRASAG